MGERVKSVVIALIHNNNVERSSYLLPLLEKLQNTLSKQFDVKLIKTTYKPLIKPHAFLMALLRDMIMSIKLSRDWMRYRLLKPPFLLLEIVGFFKSALKTKRYVQGSNRLQNSAKEFVICDNHIRAWQIFLDMDGDYLICFEDDVEFRDDSIQRVHDLLDFISKSNENKIKYIDLAGGFHPEDLKIDKLESNRGNSFKYYNKPVTNTACGYLLSRPLVDSFVDLILRKPWLRLITIDWMLNKLFILLVKSGMHFDCMHSHPSIFKHGSMTGKYVSMMRPHT